MTVNGIFAWFVAFVLLCAVYAIGWKRGSDRTKDMFRPIARKNYIEGMRLVDANELLKDAVGMECGWYKPPDNIRYVSDLIKNAPTVDINIRGKRSEQYHGI